MHPTPAEWKASGRVHAGNETQVCYRINVLLGDAPSLALYCQYPALAWGLAGVFWVNQAYVDGLGAGRDSVLPAGAFSIAIPGRLTSEGF